MHDYQRPYAEPSRWAEERERERDAENRLIARLNDFSISDKEQWERYGNVLPTSIHPESQRAKEQWSNGKMLVFCTQAWEKHKLNHIGSSYIYNRECTNCVSPCEKHERNTKQR